MTNFSVVGHRLPRVDALAKVTGAAVFSADVSLPGMLYGKVLRSPLPHALIRRLDVTRARSLKGVWAVITAEDVPGYTRKGILAFEEMAHLAKGKVVYAGQPVAAVAAESPALAEKALDLIQVTYESLPPILDTDISLQADAPLIHDGLYTNTISHPRPGSDDRPSNLAFHFKVVKGDLEAGLAQADVVVENTFRTHMVHQGFIEPFAALAAVDAGGRLTVWTQTQGFFMTQQMLSQFLDLPLDHIKVVPVEIGGAFGGKTYQPLSPLCALLARKAGRPVRMEMSRDEVLSDSRSAPESNITVKIGATRQGKITAASATLIYDAGAFPEMSHAMFVSHNMFCQYAIANVSIDAKDVLTNKVPAAFYRAPAMPQLHFAMESQMDQLAMELDLDPLELRLHNIAQEGDTTPQGDVLPRVGFKQTLAYMADQLKDRPACQDDHCGRGIACGYWRGATGSFGAQIRLNGDGSVNLILGITDISGSRTSIAQIVAEELGLSFDQVQVVCSDTDSAPWATMSVGSMTVYSLSVAVCQACEDIKAQLAKMAAKKMGVPPGEIDFKKGVFQVRTDSDNVVTIADLAKTTTSMFGGTGPVMGHGSVSGLPASPTLSVHAVDVVVDRECGKVNIRSYLAAQDVGKAINPLSVEGQIQGAVAQGIGWALMEQFVFKEGVLQNTDLLDYRIPTAVDVPTIEAKLVEVASSHGVYGLKHAGEPPMIPVPAAIANAVCRAIGVRLLTLPMTPETVLRALDSEFHHPDIP